MATIKGEGNVEEPKPTPEDCYVLLERWKKKFSDLMKDLEDQGCEVRGSMNVIFTSVKLPSGSYSKGPEVAFKDPDLLPGEIQFTLNVKVDFGLQPEIPESVYDDDS